MFRVLILAFSMLVLSANFAKAKDDYFICYSSYEDVGVDAYSPTGNCRSPKLADYVAAQSEVFSRSAILFIVLMNFRDMQRLSLYQDLKK